VVPPQAAARVPVNQSSLERVAPTGISRCTWGFDRTRQDQQLTRFDPMRPFQVPSDGGDLFAEDAKVSLQGLPGSDQCSSMDDQIKFAWALHFLFRVSQVHLLLKRAGGVIMQSATRSVSPRALKLTSWEPS